MRISSKIKFVIKGFFYEIVRKLYSVYHSTLCRLRQFCVVYYNLKAHIQYMHGFVVIISYISASNSIKYLYFINDFELI